jgi:hypothetical protein
MADRASASDSSLTRFLSAKPILPLIGPHYPLDTAAEPVMKPLILRKRSALTVSGFRACGATPQTLLCSTALTVVGGTNSKEA